MEILNDAMNLCVGEDLLERRHDVTQTADAATAVYNRDPHIVRLDRRHRTVREIWKRGWRLEAKHRRGLTPAV